MDDTETKRAKTAKRGRFTPAVLEMKAPKEGRIERRDDLSPLWLRITATGERTFAVRARIKGQAQPIRVTYPERAHHSNLEAARAWALQIKAQCEKGVDPRTAQEADEKALQRANELAERRQFETVVAAYLKRRVRGEKNNRTADDIERVFNIYFLPRWRGLSVTEIGRSDVNDALDAIYDRKVEFEGRQYGGKIAADRALAQLRACFNWFATRDDEFVSPIVRNMNRTPQSKQKRDRVLTDAELRVFWAKTSDKGTFNSAMRTLLLTAQRREEVASMARSEMSGDIWTIPPERYKTDKPNIVPLPGKVLSIIEAQDKIGNGDFVFTTTGETPFSGFGKCKDRLDAEMLATLHGEAIARGDQRAADRLAVLQKLLDTALNSKKDEDRQNAREAFRKEWFTLHDLRRTAKTLMSRAGVRPDISERVLGHVISGVEGVYDQHDYIAEKRDALERLAGLVERIVSPPESNVVMLREAAE